ncbi:unnamed protein product, partial [Prunus brigantina]
MAAPFEKRLTETDTVDKLSLPIEWLRILPPFELGCREVKIYVSDGFGFYSEFRCCRVKMGRYWKPFLQPEDWLKFVNHKGLKVGDKIILDSEPNDFVGRHFRIRAQKFNHDDDKWNDLVASFEPFEVDKLEPSLRLKNRLPVPSHPSNGAAKFPKKPEPVCNLQMDLMASFFNSRQHRKPGNRKGKSAHIICF